MTTEKVYSRIFDDKIKNNVKDSSIWQNCCHENEMSPSEQYYCYTIKFDGLTPTQCTKIEKV